METLSTASIHENLKLGEDGVLSWLHFGDLHITSAQEQNYRDFLKLIEDANANLSGAGGISFAILPGDNADDGTEAQFRLVRKGLDGLQTPVHILPGDHDIKTGKLDDFYRFLKAEPLPHAQTWGNYRCLFLNSVDTGRKEGFDFGKTQMEWLRQELARASRENLKAVLFMHTCPSELGTASREVGELIRENHVVAVDMGHTHYNEIANDGRTIYAATRSTGQIEEGPVGYSIAAIDSGVVSWKFKELEAGRPVVLITSPADRHFITGPGKFDQVAHGTVDIRAKIWGLAHSGSVTCQINEEEPQKMSRLAQTNLWTWTWDTTPLPEGEHLITVCAITPSGTDARDSITVLVNQYGDFELPSRQIGDATNAIGAYESKGILGTQLGPNKNGRKW